jgi:minimal PKS chain-length factor (CLF/KS beta)
MNAVVVTGVGVVAPNGLGLGPYWAATLRGDSGIRPITRFDPGRYPVRLAGEVRGFVAKDQLPSRLIPQTDPMTQYAIAAADWAMAEAGLDRSGLSALDLGVITASSSGGFDFGQRELQNLWSKSSRYVSAYMSFAWFYAVNTGQIAIRHNLRGPTGVFVSEQAGGLDAIAHARRTVRKGARFVLTGAIDSALCPYGITAQIASGRLSTRTQADRAYLPFDQDASGHVPGEGGAILTVEDAGWARERGAEIYGEIAGYGASFDPPARCGREPNLRRAIERALVDAELHPREVGVVFADAAAVPELDRLEARALVEVFGPGGVAVTAPKTMTGRLYAGAAPLDVVSALMTLRQRLIPPTVNVTAAPHYGIDLVVGAPRPLEGDAALVLARGFGGFNSAMILRPAQHWQKTALAEDSTDERKAREHIHSR